MRAASRLAFAIAAGVAFATVLAVVHFVLEVFVAWGHARAFLGVPIVRAASAYLLLGGAVGLLSGILAAAVAGVVGARRPRAFMFALASTVSGMTLTGIFLVRDFTFPELRLMPAELTTTIGAALLLWLGMGWTGYRVLDRRGISFHPRTAARTFSVATIAIVATTAIAEIDARHIPRRDLTSADAPNVIVILVDALRPDHLGAYGYARETSPRVDALAAEGTVFRNAYAHGNRTILSLPSLFTSLYPSYHGAVGRGPVAVPLPSDRITMAEMFRAAGYATVGLMSNVYLRAPFGLTQGFDRAEEFGTVRYRLSVYRVAETLGWVRAPVYKAGSAPRGDVVTDAALTWMKRCDKRPLFLYVHYMDVHHPYQPPAELFRDFDRGTSMMDPAALFMMTAALVQTPPPIRLGTGELGRLVDLYDACIRYTDGQIGRIVDAAKADTRGRETIIIVTSDHGDEFMEHGSVYHTNLLVEPLIRVPLVVWRSSDRIHREYNGLARHIDVLPTLAAASGIQAPEAATGISLWNAVKGLPQDSVKSTIAEGDYCAALSEPGWKIVYVDSTRTYSLFDLGTDPGAFRDVSAEHPRRFGDMRTALEGYLAGVEQRGAEQRREMDPETLRQLRALGYLQ